MRGTLALLVLLVLLVLLAMRAGALLVLAASRGRGLVMRLRLALVLALARTLRIGHYGYSCFDARLARKRSPRALVLPAVVRPAVAAAARSGFARCRREIRRL